MVWPDRTPSVSLRLVSSSLSVFSETPLTVMLVPAALKPVAESTPLASESVAEKVSGQPVLPVSETTTPPIVAAVPIPIGWAPGTATAGAPLVVTAMVWLAAAAPKLSVALTVMVSPPAVALVSVRLARSWFKSLSETPVMVMLVPAALKPVAESTPLVSLTATEKVSGEPVLPVSETITPPIVAAVSTPIVWDPGTAMAGRPLVVTAMDWLAAAAPKLSLALTMMVSEPGVALVSVRLARSAFKSLSEAPVMVMLAPAALKPVAESTPLVSLTAAEKVSGEPVAPASETLTPPIVAAVPTPMVWGPGTAITGMPWTVTAIVTGVPTPVRPSDEVTVMVSDPAVASVSLRVARSALTWATVPVSVRSVLALPPTVPWPAVWESRPLVSVSATVTVWPPVRAVASETETPEIAPAWPCWISTVAGAAATGGATPSVDPTTNWSAKPKLAVAEVTERMTLTSSGWLESKPPASTALLEKNAWAAESDVKLPLAVVAPLTATVKVRLEKSLPSPALPVTLVPARPTIRWPEMMPLLSVKSSVLVKVCEPLVPLGTNIPSVAAPNTAEKEATRPLMAPGALAAAMLALAPKMVETKLALGSIVPAA